MIPDLYQESSGDNIHRRLVGKCSRCSKSYTQSWMHFIGHRDVRMLCEDCKYPIVMFGGNAHQNYSVAIGTSYAENEEALQSIKAHTSAIGELDSRFSNSIDRIGFRYHCVWEDFQYVSNRERQKSKNEGRLEPATKKTTKDEYEIFNPKVSATDYLSNDSRDFDHLKPISWTSHLLDGRFLEEDEEYLNRVTFSKKDRNTRALALPSTTLNHFSELLEKDNKWVKFKSDSHPSINGQLEAAGVDNPAGRLAGGGKSAAVLPSELPAEMVSSAIPYANLENRAGLETLENKTTTLRWRCRCNHVFKIDVLEHQRGSAEALIQALTTESSDSSSEPSNWYSRYFKNAISYVIYFWSRRSSVAKDVLPLTNAPCHQTGIDSQCRDETIHVSPDRYICVCFPGMTYKRFLYHIDANQSMDDPTLFLSLRNRYSDWKPFWKRILTLRSLSRVEYFEFKLFYQNLVAIKEEWRDRFPQGHEPGEWAYMPTTRDMTPYLIDDVLTHYVHSPQCAKPGNYFWTRIPKKVRGELQCPDDKPFKVGWGLYFVEEFSQLYLLIVLIPVLAIGIALACWWCAKFRRSFADGATIVSGFAAVVMYFFGVAQGWGKQRGTL